MAVARCERCGIHIDLDYNVDDIVWIDNESVCCDCWTDEEGEFLSETMESDVTSVEILNWVKKNC